MNLTAHSRNRLHETFAIWDVPKDFADPFYNYLVYGFAPGSCFTAILANDFHSAIARSHPNNTVNSFKSLVGWIGETVPEQAHGSYDRVKAWCDLTPLQRRSILEQNDLIYTSKEEVVLILRDEPTTKPILY
jgi:hypothetical protein